MQSDRAYQIWARPWRAGAARSVDIRSSPVLTPLPAITTAWAGSKPSVSVVILTLDEEINIADAIASCAWSDDVHVLDSGSTDRTAEIARSLGARVHVNPFKSFGAQRNWAIDHIPLKHDWTFHLDADERFTPPLVEEMSHVLGANPSEAGYNVANQTIFMSGWIKHASGYPAYQMRLFHKARMRFKDHGHGQREETTGQVGTLNEPYLHYNFSKGLDDWFARHNRYSTAEAKQIVGQGGAAPLSDVFSGDAVRRRRALKSLGYRLPMRPYLRWLHTVIAKGAFLDGSPGLRYAAMLAIYERMIDFKIKMLRAGGTL